MSVQAEFLPIGPAEEAAILALNNRHQRETSLLDAAKLRHLLGQSYLALRAGMDDALLIAFDESADYDSANFIWFRERHKRFAYVDRIIVAEHARGRGLARQLYEALFAKAASDGHTMIACEVNSDPPNPGSDAFHAALGFEEVGHAMIYGGERTVRYLVRRLAG